MFNSPQVKLGFAEADVVEDKTAITPSERRQIQDAERRADDIEDGLPEDDTEVENDSQSQSYVVWV